MVLVHKRNHIVVSFMRCDHAEKVITFAKCVCRLFLASEVSDMRPVKATLTLLNWFHISLDVAFSRTSISSLSLWEAARVLWDSRMLSSVNLDHESGRDSLVDGRGWRNHCTVYGNKCEQIHGGLNNFWMY